MSIGTFTLIKNEIAWIEKHVENIAPHVDAMVFYDGNSTDGTLEYLKSIKTKFPNVSVHEDEDPEDLRNDYVDRFNSCMHMLPTDWAVFLHPDMWIENPQQLRKVAVMSGQALTMSMTSYAGEPGAQLYRMKTGRCNAWKNIYRLRNPDLGAHYHGWYGAWNEDVYFSQITGAAHNFHGTNFDRYPYEVIDSGLICHHFSDVRPHARRLGRMTTCLINQGHDPKSAEMLAKQHPRVSLIGNEQFKMTPCEDPRLKEKVNA